MAGLLKPQSIVFVLSERKACNMRTLTDNATLANHAAKGIIAQEMEIAARDERLTVETVRDELAAGTMVIPANVNHKNLKPKAIGRGATVKINANIGNSALLSNIEEELKKVEICERYGADALMDLSTGGDLDAIRRAIIDRATIPVGTVPAYEIVSRVEKIEDITPQLILEIIEKQAAQGVDFMTIHAGLRLTHMHMAAGRATGIVSRGGAIIAQWMLHYRKDNPFYTHFDEILKIAKKYDVTLSLGDGLRPGSLADASDAAQFAELEVLGELTRRCREERVQVMIEGPGHVPLNQIEMNMKKEREICGDAPFYVLGPIVTDIAPGYDHITAAIGSALAAYHGASFLCYVTPKEHLGLPNAEDVRNGIIAFKIAAHAADVAKGKTWTAERDKAMSKARFEFDWETQFSLALDPDRAREYFDASRNQSSECFSTAEYCTMCGPKFCAMRLFKEAKEDAKK